MLGIHKKHTEGSHKGHTGPTKSHQGKRAQKAKTRTGMSSPSARLVAPLARRRTQLKEKGKTRPHKQIVKRLPAGSGVLGAVPKGKDFTSGGTKQAVDINAYCEAVRGATETFKEGHRATSTALEHDMYMRLINCWAERSGFGTYVVRRENVGVDPPTVRAAKDERTGELMVLKPEMIVGLLLEMATGDENMPKGGHPEDLARLAATDDKNLAGPRGGWTRKKGDYGYGAHNDEPWSLQAMEKRIYAMRDFYARELKGTHLDDPASDPLVTGTLAALVLLIGRKSMHVPKVCARAPSTDLHTTACARDVHAIRASQD